ADSDDADRGRLYQRDREPGLHPPPMARGNDARRQPAGRSASHNDDRSYRLDQDSRRSLAKPKGGRLPLQVRAQGKARPEFDRIEQLLLVSTVGAEGGVVEVESLEIDIQVTVDVIAGTEVHLGVGVDEGRLRAELRVVLLLAKVIEVFIAPVER